MLSFAKRSSQRAAARRRRPGARLVCIVAAVAALAVGGGTIAVGPTGASGVPSHRRSARSRHSTAPRGGSLTVLENATYAGAWPEGFDPDTNTDALANSSEMDAIYGTLFDASAHHLVGDLAKGYAFSDSARTLTIRLRPNLRFSDNTPLNAAAVIFNWRRDLAGSNPAKPPWPAVQSMAAAGPTTVVIRFADPDGSAIIQLQSSTLNWLVSPSALDKLGKRFAFFPVGAGPFKVVRDVTNTKLTLERNPRYWEAGHPYLSKLVFLSVASDEAALEALQANDGQAYEYMATPELVPAFRKAGLVVTADPGDTGTNVQLNTLRAPFNSLKAREAIYYAINAKAIDSHVDDGTCPVTESFSGPGSQIYEPQVPGYRTYDLAKAKALVKSLGGLSFTLMSTSVGNGVALSEALQAMFQAAGMRVTLLPTHDLSQYIEEFSSHQWQAVSGASIGSWNPASGGAGGLAFRLFSHAPFSGVNDEIVDHDITQAAATTSLVTQKKLYAALAETLSRQALTPFICSPDSWDIAKKGVSGPGLTSPSPVFSAGPLVLWQDVSVKG